MFLGRYWLAHPNEGAKSGSHVQAPLQARFSLVSRTTAAWQMHLISSKLRGAHAT
jgi:hypothetical protein